MAAPTVDRPRRLTRDADLASLLEATASGDADAFAGFYDATAALAYGLALRVIGNRALAEEVTQEAYLGLFQAAGRFDRHRGSPAAFLMTMVHRRAVDKVRATRAALRRDEVYERQHPARLGHDATAEDAHASLEAEQVRAALAGLSSGQREALELAYYDGLTHVEVAAALGVPLGTAKSRIRAGLTRLRRLLEGRLLEGGFTG